MQTSEITALNRTLEKTEEWLATMVEDHGFGSHEQAYSALRAVLHGVRDQLTAEEAAHLASQLPMLVRGFYWEGWRPALAPNDIESVDDFYERVSDSLARGGEGPPPEAPAGARETPTAELTRRVLAFLDATLDPGGLRHVRAQLPDEIEALWPQPATA